MIIWFNKKLTKSGPLFVVEILDHESQLAELLHDVLVAFLSLGLQLSVSYLKPIAIEVSFLSLSRLHIFLILNWFKQRRYYVTLCIAEHLLVSTSEQVFCWFWSKRIWISVNPYLYENINSIIHYNLGWRIDEVRAFATGEQQMLPKQKKNILVLSIPHFNKSQSTSLLTSENSCHNIFSISASLSTM